MVDWFKAIYLQTKPDELLNVLKKIGFKNFRRLNGPHKNDLDISMTSSVSISGGMLARENIEFLKNLKINILEMLCPL